MTLGRPRAFDLKKALDRALEVFWCKGYEGASLPDLTRAMGINRPSLYAAFGNKEELFIKALDRYAEKNAWVIQEALAEPTARAFIERLLYSVADECACYKTPRACLLVQGALACGSTAEPIKKELAARRNDNEAVLRKRFERARTEGDLPQGASPADLARYFTTVLNGLSVQAAGGAGRRELRRVVAMALKSWPE